MQDRSLENLLNQLIRDWARLSGFVLPDGPRLLVFHESGPQPRTSALPSVRDDVALQIAAGAQAQNLKRGEMTVALSSSRNLPLQKSCCAAAVLCNVASVGEEPELSEVCRVLQPDGRLFILGLNRWGWRYLSGGEARELPGVRPLALRRKLERFDMTVEGLWAAGFFRTDRPRQINQGLSRILIPLADVFLIVARPAEAEIINPLEKSRLRAVGSPSAVAGR